jgi:hypothetical protein
MRGSRFDEIARASTTPTSRRRLVGRLAGGALGALPLGLTRQAGGAAGSRCRAAGRRCAGNRRCCSGRCGADRRCQKGLGGGDGGCAVDADCADGLCCEGLGGQGTACVDPQTDGFNCGGCGLFCQGLKPGSACVGGTCRCTAGQQDCRAWCKARCETDPARYRDRFRDCLVTDFGPGRRGDCGFCAGWVGCYGALDTGTYCYTVTAGC